MRGVYDRIRRAPLCEAEVTDARERLHLERALDRLMGMGAVIRAALTPTDVFNAVGLSSIGDVDASALGLEAAARFVGVAADLFARRVFSAIEERLFFEIIGSSLGAEGSHGLSDFGILSAPISEWLRTKKDGRGVDLDIKLKDTIVGVGAPVGLFVTPVAERLGARCVVPQDAAVAGAVGAVSGVVSATREAVIRAFGDGGFVLFTPTDRKTFAKLPEARAAAMEELSALVREEIEKGPGFEARMTGDWDEHWGGQGENKILIEARLTMRAIGRYSAASSSR